MTIRAAVAVAALTLTTAPMVFAQDIAPGSDGTIRGIVVDATDGTPIRQVSVRLQANASTTLTGDDGRFVLSGVTPGPQELYVSVVDFMLVKRTVVVPAGGSIDVTIPIAPGTGTYTEKVTVRPENESSPSTAAVTEQKLASTELQQLRGLITNDPFRAVQSLPGVAAGDDLRSEFSVRGLAVDHMNFTFEGVAAPFLVHTVQGIHDSGSIAMVNGDLLDEIVLATGSYPEYYGDRIGAELDFRLREGSRDGVKSHVSMSFTDAAIVLEGPLARRNGSWLMSVRKSYLDRFIRKLDPANDFAFGFTDAQAKLVYDVNARQQAQLALTVGQSRLDRRVLGTPNPDAVKDGRNSTAIGVLTWRSLVSPRLVVTQKVSGTTNSFRNVSETLQEFNRGRVTDAIYRLDWSYGASASLTFHGGGQLRRTNEKRHGTQIRSATYWDELESFSAGAMSDGAFGEARLTTAGTTINAGARIDHWDLTHHTAASPWIQIARPLTAGISVRAGAGIYRQQPSFLETVGTRGRPTCDLERATQVDVAIEGKLTALTRWQITGYDRSDRGLVTLPNSEYRVVGGRLAGPSGVARYQNLLDGYSRGLDFSIQRRSANSLSGWLSYSLSYTKDHDRLSGETFWGDWDQRHTVNAYASYRLGAAMSASSRFRYGSNFPATGYWETRDGRNYLSTVRNALRVPPYSRLDLRFNRTFTWSQKRLTLFVEVINVYARKNVRFSSSGINGRTLETFGLFDTMLPRIPSLGFLLEL